MKKRLLGFALSALLCLSLAVPALAADKAPDISITWLSVEGQPWFYNRDQNWLTIENGLCYIIDLETGKEVNNYPFAWYSSEGLTAVWAETEDSEDGYFKCGYIDKTGAVVVPPVYNDAQPFSEGLAAVYTKDADGNWKWGYIDKTGAVVVPPEYDDVYSFFDGLAVVKKNGRRLELEVWLH